MASRTTSIAYYFCNGEGLPCSREPGCYKNGGECRHTSDIFHSLLAEGDVVEFEVIRSVLANGEECAVLTQKNSRYDYFCEICGEHQPVLHSQNRSTFMVRGKKYSFMEQVAHCRKCGAIVYVPELNDINADLRKLSVRLQQSQEDISNQIPNQT